MYIPFSTYRLQLNSSFTLNDVKNYLEYFHQLGITTLYGSPLFTAVPGSEHGYNVANSQQLNPEIGSISEFAELSALLKNKTMGWIQDIVPNHMAFDSSNVWLMDVFEKGHHSDYYLFFDIDWKHPSPGLEGKVMAPLLSDEPEVLLKNGELSVSFTQQGFYINFPGQQFPVCWASYYFILSLGVTNSEENMESPEYRDFRNLVEDLKLIAENFNSEDLLVNEMTHHKETLYAWYQQGGVSKKIIENCLHILHTKEGALRQLLDMQVFVLVPWILSDRRINYRRFFTVNELICLSMEKEKVFESYHYLVKELLHQNLVQGLRIDHIDGLYNPLEYLHRLSAMAGKNIYIIVEKILNEQENVEFRWPVQGTSGYDFLADVNQLFTSEKRQDTLTEVYHSFIRETPDYSMIVFDKKLTFLVTRMQGELDNLVRMLQDMGVTAIVIPERLKEALAIAMCCFPVYRIYGIEYPLPAHAVQILNRTFQQAVRMRPGLEEELTFLLKLLKNEQGIDVNTDAQKHFLMRLEQFTGPLAAKGVEDTAFYVFNRLISHNEVGDTPSTSGIEIKTFHEKMQVRLKEKPYSLNATATHDTKRGEDARMRINVLSEIPEEWSAAVHAWKEANQKYVKGSPGNEIPSANEEYFIYQALLGGFPLDAQVNDEFIKRFKAYLLKSIREAKVHTDANEPDETFEKDILTFIDNILANDDFMQKFIPFTKKVSHWGLVLSLSQTLVKVTAPGIPDVYQGTELWDFSYVDPDNRRPVDFSLRNKFLQQLYNHADPEELVKNRTDGRIKLFLIHKALQDRKINFPLYLDGEYISLHFAGEKSEALGGFARRLAGEWRIIIFPVEASGISTEDIFPVGDVWGDTVVVLPNEAPSEWMSVLSEKEIKALEEDDSVEANYSPNGTEMLHPVKTKYLELKHVLAQFSVAMLMNKTSIIDYGKDQK